MLTMDQGKALTKRVGSDVVCFIIIVFGIMFVKYGLSPVKKGFFCEDFSIRYPQCKSTVSDTALYITSVGFPVLSIASIEMLEHQGRTMNLFGREVPHSLYSSYKEVGLFLYGMAVTQFLTEVAKVTVGRLRPNYMKCCNIDDFCDKPKNRFRYISPEEVPCNIEDEDGLRKSFPSGHASMSAFGMLYLSLYLQYKMPELFNRCPLLRSLVQTCLLAFAMFTGLSRLRNNKHHMLDVLIGMALGYTVAILVAFYQRCFRTKDADLSYWRKKESNNE